MESLPPVSSERFHEKDIRQDMVHDVTVHNLWLQNDGEEFPLSSPVKKKIKTHLCKRSLTNMCKNVSALRTAHLSQYYTSFRTLKEIKTNGQSRQLADSRHMNGQPTFLEAPSGVYSTVLWYPPLSCKLVNFCITKPWHSFCQLQLSVKSTSR